MTVLLAIFDVNKLHNAVGMPLQILSDILYLNHIYAFPIFIIPNCTFKHGVTRSSLKHYLIINKSFDTLPKLNISIIDVMETFFIHKNIIGVKQCETLKLKRVVSASMLVSSDDILMYEKSFHDVNDRYIKFGERVKTFIEYQIMLQTTPGDAMFEGTIRYDEY
jgi:hypothetical protein